MTMQIGLKKPLFAAKCVLLVPKCPTIAQKYLIFVGAFCHVALYFHRYSGFAS
jgi:hypothetical protein